MLTWPWWTYSILAALIWGLHFNLVVRIAGALPRDISTPLTLFLISAASILLALPFTYQRIFANIETLIHASPQVRVAVVLMVFTTLSAATLLNIAMQLSANATLASILDITYPIFVALIAWLVFKENTIDWTVVVGGGLIFAGSMLIIWRHG